MASVKELLIKYVADTTQFTRGTDKAAGSMKGLVKSALALGAGYLGFSALKSGIQNTLKLTDENAKLARGIGATVQQVDSLKLAMELAGLSSEKLNLMMQKFQVNLYKIDSAITTESFKKLGMDLFQVPVTETYDLVLQISKEIQKLSKVEATGIISDLMGGGRGAAMRMQKMLEQLRGVDEEVRHIYEALGLSNKSAEDVEALNDSYTKLKHTLGLITRAMLTEMAPAVTGFWESIGALAVAVSGKWAEYNKGMQLVMDEVASEGYGRVRQVMAGLGMAINVIGTDTTWQQIIKHLEDVQEAGEETLDFFQFFADQLNKGLPMPYENLIDYAEKMKDAIKDPWQTFEEEKEKIKAAHETGDLTDEQFYSASQRIFDIAVKADEGMQKAIKLAEQYGNKLQQITWRYEEIIRLENQFPSFIEPEIKANAIQSLADEALGQFNITGGDATERYQSAFSQLNAAAGSLSPELLQAVGASIEQAFGVERTEELQSFADALQQATMTPAEEFAAEMQALNDALNAGAISWELYARGAEQARDALYQTTEAAQYMRELQSFAQSEFMATRNPFEEYDMHMRKLNDALSAGVLDWDTYNRSMMNAAADMDKALGLDSAGGQQGGSPLMNMLPQTSMWHDTGGWGLQGPVGMYTSFHPGEGGGPPPGPGTAGFATASQIDAVLAGTGAQSTAREQLQETKKIRMLTERYVRESPAGIIL